MCAFPYYKMYIYELWKWDFKITDRGTIGFAFY